MIIARRLLLAGAAARYVNQATPTGTVRRYTGDGTPYEFRQVDITDRIFGSAEWPESPPWSPSDFRRLDESDDNLFYAEPKLVYHVDEPALAALTQYYRRSIPRGSSILDLCSSWVSHYPREFDGFIAGVGISARELQYNDQLTEFKAQDLNKNQALPYRDATFDVATCVVSIDYLTKPVDVLKEVRRVLKKDGRVIISQSNRLFYTKAVRMWLGMGDDAHLELIGQYLQYAGFQGKPKALDITPKGGKDPMYIVECAV